MMDLVVVAQGGSYVSDAIGAIAGACCSLLPVVAIIAGMWKTFDKAGKPGWAAIVPIYNMWVLVEISGKENWWFFLFFIPIANLVAAFVVSIAVAEQFGKGTGYGIGLALLGFVFFPLLGFGDAEFQGGGQAPAM